MFEYDSFLSDFSDKGLKILKDEPLCRHTTFRIGGSADLFIEVFDLSQLTLLIEYIKSNNIPFFLLGNGSNLLVSDAGFRGIVIKLSGEFKDIKLLDEEKIECGCGVSLAKVCVFAMQNSLSGLEFAWGIPGSCGGAVYMNAGAYEGEMSNLIESSKYLNFLENKVQIVSKKDMHFSYRKSLYTDKNHIAVSMTLKLLRDKKEKIKEKMRININKRKSKQPLDFPNCGSVFKRPGDGYYVGSMIEKCGLKGKSFGGAMVSPKHAGFIINTGNATCEDVVRLICYIKKTVLKTFGVLLECEVKTLGDVGI